MNVQEVIDHLMLIKDKTKTVSIVSEFGMGCFSKSDDIIVSDCDDEVLIEGHQTSDDTGK